MATTIHDRKKAKELIAQHAEQCKTEGLTQAEFIAFIADQPGHSCSAYQIRKLIANDPFYGTTRMTNFMRNSRRIAEGKTGDSTDVHRRVSQSGPLVLKKRPRIQRSKKNKDSDFSID